MRKPNPFPTPDEVDALRAQWDRNLRAMADAPIETHALTPQDMTSIRDAVADAIADTGIEGAESVSVDDVAYDPASGSVNFTITGPAHVLAEIEAHR